MKPSLRYALSAAVLAALYLMPASPARAQQRQDQPQLYKITEYYDVRTRQKRKRMYTAYKGPVRNGRQVNIRHGVELMFYPNGAKMRGAYYRHGQAHGEFQAWADNGNVTIKGQYEEGRKQGAFQFFYPSGTPKMTVNYLDGKRNGLMQLFDTQGNKRVELTYVQNKRHGMARRWHANGALAESVAFIDDNKNGMEKQFRYDGRLEYECGWLAGKKHGTEVYYHPVENFRQFVFNWNKGRRHGPSIEYSSAARQRLLITFDKDRVHGPMRVWDTAGNIVSDGVYRNNKPFAGMFKESGNLPGFRFENSYRDGELVDGTLYHEDVPYSGTYSDYWRPGKPRRMTNYVNGKIEGREESYYENGQVESLGFWSHNRLNGTYTEWFDDGQKRWEVATRDGRKHGPEAIWSPRGFPIAYGENRNGKPYKGYLPVWVTYEQTEGGWAIQNFLNGAEVSRHYRHPDLEPPPNQGELDLSIFPDGWDPTRVGNAGGRGTGPNFGQAQRPTDPNAPAIPAQGEATGWQEFELLPEEPDDQN